MSLLLFTLLTACGTNTPATTPTAEVLTATPAPSPTRLPTVTPTPLPLGSPQRPYVIGAVVEQSTDEMTAAAQEIARRLSATTQLAVNAKLYPDYASLLDELQAGKVQLVWLPPLTYLYVSQRSQADAALLSNHFGVYAYGAQYLANVESSFIPYFDPQSSLTSADAATALAQFAGKRPCWVDPLSPSGYIAPAGQLNALAITTLPPVFVQNHTALVRALYIKGICDFGATFAISGDPRTADAVLKDLPDTLNRVIVIWRTDGVIPNLSLSFAAGISQRDRQSLVNALLDVAKTPEGRALLTLSVGNYQIDELKVVDDSVYDPLRKFVGTLNLNAKDFPGK